MKLYLVDPHDKRLYKNGLFNKELDQNFIVWVRIKKLLLQKKIILDTIDLHPVTKADKIFFFDHDSFTFFNNKISPYLKLCLDNKISKSKLNLVITECPIIKPSSWSKNNHLYYGKIFTWDDSLVDNQKYFHYLWPQNLETNKIKEVPFNKKKLITLINARKTNYAKNELYSLRITAIKFFEKKYPYDFDLYGFGWDKSLNIKYAHSILNTGLYKVSSFILDYINSLRPIPSYMGKIKNKFSVLSRYKYCLCFENMENIDGYITEKIFDCFKARTVPIYLGASNILKYIPKETMIDFRDFNDFDRLYKYLLNISEKEYQSKINSIDKFLKDKFYEWDYKHLVKNIFLK